MSGMDKKLDEALKSHSSSSRRVMWKLTDEDDEAFDTFTKVTPLKAKLPSTSTQAVPDMKSTGSGNTYASDAWHQIYKLIRANKLAEELKRPSTLGLRYKPSSESLKHKYTLSCFKSQKHHQTGSEQGKANDLKMIVTDVKLESCCWPPNQMAVVREVAPTFAQRIPNDTDSSNSYNLDVPYNTPVGNNFHASSELSLDKASTQIATSSSALFSKLNAVIANQPASDSTPIKKNCSKKSRSGQTRPASSAKNISTNNKTILLNRGFPTFRQRQLELHNYRVQVEQRRLDLLELKIAREREDAVHNEILFQKELQIKERLINSTEEMINETEI